MNVSPLREVRYEPEYQVEPQEHQVAHDGGHRVTRRVVSGIGHEVLFEVGWRMKDIH